MLPSRTFRHLCSIPDSSVAGTMQSNQLERGIHTAETSTGNENTWLHQLPGRHTRRCAVFNGIGNIWIFSKFTFLRLESRAPTTSFRLRSLSDLSSENDNEAHSGGSNLPRQKSKRVRTNPGPHISHPRGCQKRSADLETCATGCFGPSAFRV